MSSETEFHWHVIVEIWWCFMWHKYHLLQKIYTQIHCMRLSYSNRKWFNLTKFLTHKQINTSLNDLNYIWKSSHIHNTLPTYNQRKTRGWVNQWSWLVLNSGKGQYYLDDYLNPKIPYSFILEYGYSSWLLVF